MASLLCSAVAAAVLAAANLRLRAALSCKPFFRLPTAAAAHTDRPERVFACTCQAHECCGENAACCSLAARAPTPTMPPFISVQDVTPRISTRRLCSRAHAPHKGIRLRGLAIECGSREVKARMLHANKSLTGTY